MKKNLKTVRQKDIVCPECKAGPFKTLSGLAGHRQIAHSTKVKTKKIERDEIAKRLDAVEAQLIATVDPEKIVDNEDKLLRLLRLLLPSMEKYRLEVLCKHKKWYSGDKECQIIKTEGQADVGLLEPGERKFNVTVEGEKKEI